MKGLLVRMNRISIARPNAAKVQENIFISQLHSRHRRTGPRAGPGGGGHDLSGQER